MANIFLKRDDSCVPNGWGNWTFVDNYIAGYGIEGECKENVDEPLDVPKNDAILFNDAPFPKKYLPAEAFQIESIISHCVFVWKFLKPVEMHSGSTISSEYDCYQKDKHVYGIGIEPRDPVSNSDYYEIDAPEMGYCVSNVFKQHLYTHLTLEEQIDEDDSCDYNTVVRLYGTPKLQVLQNSRLKQIYVYEGTVKCYYCGDPESGAVEEGEEVCYLDIGLNRSLPVSVAGAKITIKGPTHDTDIVLDINGATDDGRLIVTQTTDITDIPQAGDYYTLDTPWCIEDPFLMSGFWKDSETTSGSSGSGLDLYVTTHNSPFESGKFMGAYVWSDTSKPISSINNMDGSGGNEWNFLWLNNINDYFPDGTRYKEEVGAPAGDRCANTYREQITGYLDYESRNTASSSDLTAFIEKNNFVRVEIQTGGDRDRHNWFAPALKGQYIKVDSSIYKIINHITSHIIDIAKTSIDGSTEISIDEYTTYEIINHKSWMLIEHYDGNDFECEKPSSSQSYENRWGESDGLFKGEVYSTSYDETADVTHVVLDVEGDHCGAWIKNTDPTDEFPGNPPPESERYNTANNFINRYKQTHSHDSSEPLKKYEKFDKWKLVRTYSPNESCESIIEDFEIDPDYFDLDDHPSWPEAFNPYTLDVYVKGDATSELNEGDECFVAFDDSFKTICCEREGRYYLDFGSVLDHEDQSDCRDEGPVAPLCIDGGYISNQYIINIPKDARIGYCEGKYWGVNGCATVTYDAYNNSSVFEDYGLYLHINTIQKPDIKGISSMYSNLSRRDLVAYEDVNNLKLQLRIGADDFQAYPIKYEFAVGALQTESLTGSEGNYQLNNDYDRLNMIQFSLPNGEECPPMFYTISLGDDYQYTTHGFSIGGRGDISLDTLINCENGEYTDAEGKPIAPILARKNLDTTTNLTKVVPLATRTDVSGIQIDPPPESVTGYYVNDNQTIRKGMGFFDLLRVSDGEIYLIFNQDVGEFKSGEEYPIWDEEDLDEATDAIENARGEGNNWDKRSGVMMIGTNDGTRWGTPYVDINKMQPDKFLMILNAVEYLTSFYDPLQRVFGVFVKCSNPVVKSSDEQGDFVAFFSISYTTLSHKAYECDPLDESGDEEYSCCEEYEYEEFDLDKADKREF